MFLEGLLKLFFQVLIFWSQLIVVFFQQPNSVVLVILLFIGRVRVGFLLLPIDRVSLATFPD